MDLSVVKIREFELFVFREIATSERSGSPMMWKSEVVENHFLQVKNHFILELDSVFT